jgi:triosephosphate isomerase
VGHSERREYFGETHDMLREKLLIALKYGLKPVFCCGEPLEIRRQNAEQNFVFKQLEESLFALSTLQLEQIIIAYEPVWAIGTGLNASTAQAQEMHLFIRKQIHTKYGAFAAGRMPILYGGSVKPSNAAELFSAPDVDGGLVGGASLNAKDFLAIIDTAA